MIEFFYCLGGVIICWFVLSLRKQTKQDIDMLLPPSKNEPPPIKPAPAVLTVVARSVNDIIGTYLDLPIYQYVQLEDDRMFTYESIAIEKAPGVYHAEDKSGTYIVVDKCFLYKEVPVELDKY